MIEKAFERLTIERLVKPFTYTRRRDDFDSLFRESSDDVVDRTRRGRTVCYQVLKVERRRKKVCRERSHENHEDIMVV